MRILSPYYGNTIFNVSSVISVILAALSLGYYLGGKLADRKPELKWFFGIIFASGLAVFCLQLLNFAALPLFGRQLNLISGPLIASIILFFLPGWLLGMLSPFAIKLQVQLFPTTALGAVTGKIFFWSTVGSITGSLLAGFFLIPRFGLDKIIIGTAIVLTLIGLTGLAVLKTRTKYWFFILAFLILSLSLLTRPASDYLYAGDGIYGKIFIYDGLYQGRPARFLVQDLDSSAAMYLESSDFVYNYTKYIDLYELVKAKPKSALFIGGGAYTLPKYLKERGVPKIDVLEIEPEIFNLGKKFFKVPETGINNILTDGRYFLTKSDANYDLIINDAFHSLSVPGHLTTKEFLQTVSGHLTDDGIYWANNIGSLSPEPPSYIMSEINTFRAVFPNSYFIAVEDPNDYQLQNFVFVGIKNPKLVLEPDKLQDSSRLIFRDLAKHLVETANYDLKNFPILTDNFSPVDFFTAKAYQRAINQQ